ncbi:MAG: hypothetical protein GTN49_08725 [candidate division Zixibacteria bacterium]|nr:hypothetical protein [candidate division Zixibacteria bacterium]
MEENVWKEIEGLLEAEGAAAAVARCRIYWDEVDGPRPQVEGDDLLREFNRRLTVWQQIDLFVWEVNRRPHNPRTWKLLGYAYMWAGLYIPLLLRAAEQALLASVAQEEDAALAVNLEEKMELCRRALAGDRDARAEIAAGERAFASGFVEFPASVPMPEPFVRSGIVGQSELKVTAAVIAPDLLEILND